MKTKQQSVRLLFRATYPVHQAVQYAQKPFLELRKGPHGFIWIFEGNTCAWLRRVFLF